MQLEVVIICLLSLKDLQDMINYPELSIWRDWDISSLLTGCVFV